MSNEVVVDAWAEVIGQPAAVASLRAAAASPTHAYLLVGRQGYGTRALARAFAGEVLATAAGADPERHRTLAAAERHPAVSILEKGSDTPTRYLEEVRRQAHLAPVEGTLQVLVVTDVEMALGHVAMLLKTIEEPPPSTVFVILVDDVTDELVTVASRCVRIDVGPVPTEVVRSALVGDGVEAERAAVVAAVAGGDLDRARLLVRDESVMARHRFWLGLPARLVGTGSVVVELVDGIAEQFATVIGPLEARQAEELEALDAELEAMGIRGAGRRTELVARHKREVRQVRLDELHAGLDAVIGVYRDRVTVPGGAAAFTRAADAVGELESHLDHNPNERLALLDLLLSLPPLP